MKETKKIEGWGAEYTRNWRKANPEKRAAQQKRYQEKHRERLNAYRNEWAKRKKAQLSFT